MQCATFTPTLAPNQGDDKSTVKNGHVTNGTLSSSSVSEATHPPPPVSNGPQADAGAADRTHREEAEVQAKEAAPAGQHQNGDSSRRNSMPPGDETPSSRRRPAAGGYPVYQAGVVQAVSANSLPPPPPKRASSSGSLTPTVSSTALPALGTPPRQTSKDSLSTTPKVSSGPSSNGINRYSVGAESPARSSPSRRRSNPNERTSSSRIDPEQVPRPVGQTEAVKVEGGKVFETNKYQIPPPMNTVCTIVDKGSSSCEFMRCTVNQMPSYPSTANTTHVPMAVLCQPFAELTAYEEPIPLVDYGECGPLRCHRCRAYGNPHFVWASGGKEAICNFCAQRMEVPPEYYSALDDRGHRRDQGERPEFVRGTVDYVAPKDYSDVIPGLPGIAFVIDSSRQSVQSGLFHLVIWTIRQLLSFLPQPAPKVAVMTFDQTLQFHAFHPGLDEARIITVADIEDPFVPCSAHSLCVDPTNEAYSGQIEALLERLPSLKAEEAGADQAGQYASQQVAGGAALKAAVDLISSHGGGHVIMFHAALPNTGVGALRNRDDIRLYGTPEGAALYTPQQAAFFDAISADCLSNGVAVSSFLAPAHGTYVDVASLSVLPRRTGGEVIYMPGFDPVRNGEELHYAISRTVMQGAAYSCVFKLRCGKGLNIDAMYAPWEPELIDQGTFQVSRMSTDATAIFLLSHSERIEGQKHAYIQAACLHTDRCGRRLIRVHTLQLPVTSSLSNVFRFTEIDAVTSTLLKQAAACAIKGDNSFKDRLTKSCVDMLHAYRINCASTTAAGQLILPESLKLLPLYVGAIRKMPAFRTGSDVRMDDRVASLARILGLPLGLSAPLLYPRVYQVLPLPDRSPDAGKPTGVGDNVYLPHTVACSYERLNHSCIYLVENGIKLHVYISPEVSGETLQRAFGVSTAAEVPAVIAQMQMPEAQAGWPSEDAERIVAMVNQIRADRGRLPWMPLCVVVPGTADEPRLLSLLSEDRVAGEMQYVDFLCHIHKLVQNKLD